MGAMGKCVCVRLRIGGMIFSAPLLRAFRNAHGAKLRSTDQKLDQQIKILFNRLKTI